MLCQQKTFWEHVKELKTIISQEILFYINSIKDNEIKHVLQQRNLNSFFAKGIIAYYVCEGLKADLNQNEKIKLSVALELYCSSLAIIDNVIDNHFERNGKTTLLKEYGNSIHILAAHYTHHLGLKILLPYLDRFIKQFSDFYEFDMIIYGMSQMDLKTSRSLDEQLRNIELTNGLFMKIPLLIAASCATEEKTKIDMISSYGFNLGVGLGIYEEVRDLFGYHGRMRCTEVESGRICIPMHYAALEESSFDPLTFSGRKLSDTEYWTLIDVLYKTDSFIKTKDLISEYFRKAQNGLDSSLSGDAVATLKLLFNTVENEFDNIVF